MAFEGVNRGANNIDRSEGAFEAANQLIAENELLRNNPRIKALQENDFITEDGRELDPGDFIAKMLNYLESENGDPDTALKSGIENYIALHSTAPGEERKLGDSYPDRQ